MNIEQLANIIENTHVQLQQSAVKAVNQCQTIRNWLIGFYIVEFEQNGEDRAKYGEQLLKTLERKVNQKGLNVTLFQRSRAFYFAYPQFSRLIEKSFMIIQATALPKLITKDGTQIYATLLPKLQMSASQNDKVNLPVEKLLNSVSFAHFVELMKIDEPVKRLYYEMLTVETCLSVRELKRQIASLAYERVGLSGNMEKALETIKQKIHPQTVSDVVKDDYFFEFLNVPQRGQDLIKEKEQETLLLDNLRDFILELGNGFCLEARQKRFLIGDEFYFVDLVFFHRILRCHFLLELKVSSFDHAHVSQLYTYLNYYKAEMMESGDNPPIGILLVTDKNDAFVQYATAGMDEQVFVSRYKLQLPTEQQLKELILRNIRG